MSYTKYIPLSGKTSKPYPTGVHSNHSILKKYYKVQLDMPYLIDGHNLIPKLGLRLDSIDDEMELIAILQEFCRVERRQAEVFFDGAPAGHAGTRKLGAVTAHFVRLGDSADNAIRNRLKRLGKSAKNWTVVSSDRQVQVEARAAQAEVTASDAFAAMLKQARNSAPKPNSERNLSPKEVEDWLKLFEERNRNKKFGG
jgi:predicted RNA-binding protein with PIN domain